MVQAIEVSRALISIWGMEERTRSSIYATTQTVVWPWSDPGVAASSKGESIKLDWLLEGPNTLYLCAPIEDQKRLAPRLRRTPERSHRAGVPPCRPDREGTRPPAPDRHRRSGQHPLRALPEYASTLAGIGVLLVTIWQSLAQIDAAYRRHADTILTNHLTKVFYAGLSDPASLRYVNHVLGTPRSRRAPGRGSSASAPARCRSRRPGSRWLPRMRCARCDRVMPCCCTAPFRPPTFAPAPSTGTESCRPGLRMPSSTTSGMSRTRSRSSRMPPHHLQMLALTLAGLTVFLLSYVTLGWLLWTTA